MLEMQDSSGWFPFSIFPLLWPGFLPLSGSEGEGQIEWKSAVYTEYDFLWMKHFLTQLLISNTHGPFEELRQTSGLFRFSGSTFITRADGF